MTESRSLLTRFTRVAGQVGSILSRVDLDLYGPAEVKLIGTIKHLLQDARLDIRDWELADSRAEMQKYARDGLKRIEQVRASILMASERDIFTAVEVAEISAQLDFAANELRQSFALPEEP
jgi:DNA-binding FrmR family transcriptional regulator